MEQDQINLLNVIEPGIFVLLVFENSMVDEDFLVEALWNLFQVYPDRAKLLYRQLMRSEQNEKDQVTQVLKSRLPNEIYLELIRSNM